MAVKDLSSRRSAMFVLGAMGGAAGAAFFLEKKPWKGILEKAKAFDVQTRIEMDAPVETVYSMFANPETFPLFMRHVEDVRRLSENTFSWRLRGPAKIPVEWKAVVTEMVPDQTLAWRTVPGSDVTHAGVLHFYPTAPGGCGLIVRLRYEAPGGAAGQALMKALGDDPAKMVEEDLLILKEQLESNLPAITIPEHVMG